MECYRTNGKKRETPVIIYPRGEKVITAIGTIHIGHPEYYQAIQERINQQDEGFFEGIGKPCGPVSDDKKRFVEALQRFLSYEKVAEILGLKTQAKCLKYPESWKNVDVTLDELVNRMSLEELKAQKIAETYTRIILEKIEKDERKKAAWTLRTAYSLVRRNQTEYRPSSSGMRDYYLHRAIGERCDGNQKGSLGVVYGSNHLDSLDCYLNKKGFKTTEVSWLVAIDINRIARESITILREVQK